MSLSEALSKAMAGLPSSARATTFEDESIKSTTIDGYKPKENVTDRIVILDPKLVVVGRTHYGGEGVGYVLCKSEWKMEAGSEVLFRRALCCTHMDEAKLRIVVPIGRYLTKPNGELVKPLAMEYLVWRINEEKFSQLRQMHKEWGLDSHDLLVNCTDEKFQRLTISITRERLLLHPEVQKAFGAEVNGFLAAVTPKLARQLGQDLTEPQLLEKLGKVATTTVAVSDAPIGSIDDLLGKSVSA